MKRLIYLTVNIFVLFTICSLTLAVEDKDEAVVASWHFDEGEGEVVKNSSTQGGNDGVIHGARWVGGKIGKALSFDGKDDYVEFLSPEILSGAEQFTIRFWFKPNVNLDTTLTEIRAQIIAKGFTVGIDYDNRGWITVVGRNDAGGKFGYMTIKRTYDKDTWYYLAYVYDGSDNYVYENGVLLSSFLGEGKVESSNKNLTIGMLTGYGHYFNGVVDEVLILNRALNPKEVREDYRAMK